MSHKNYASCALRSGNASLIRSWNPLCVSPAALCLTRAFFASTNALLVSAPRHYSHPRHGESLPQLDAPQRKPRRVVQRTSLLDQLSQAEQMDESKQSSAATSSPAAASSAALQPHDNVHTHSLSTAASSPYLTSSEFISPQQKAEANSAAHAAHAKASPPLPPAASLQLQEQQRALRDAFTHARAHHNVKLKKDPRVYRAECKAFRQAHQGRHPTPQEVSPTVAVPLAPVAALKTLAHTDRRRSVLHAATEEAVLLHNAVAKNELVKSNAPQLVRCLRCFHVYTARPRTLWGSEVQQSGIEYEKAQARVAANQRLQRRPWLRKSAESIGRRRRAQEEDPTCCPQCGSPRAQWMMEYVHHHTHEKT